MLRDIEQLRIHDVKLAAAPIMTQAINVAEAEEEWFIKGPIPGPWISKAANLGGDHTLHVALTIQYVRGLKPKSTTVLLERFHFDRLGVQNDSTRRALRRLQEAGLIEYRKVGQKFHVAILPVELGDSTGNNQSTSLDTNE